METLYQLAELIDGYRLERGREHEAVTAWGVPDLDPCPTYRVRIGEHWFDEVLAGLWASLADVPGGLPYAKLNLQVRLVARSQALRAEGQWPTIERRVYTASTRLVGPVRIVPGSASWARIGRTPVHELVRSALESISRYELPRPEDPVMVRCRLRRVVYQRKTIRRAMHRGLRELEDRWLAWYLTDHDVAFVTHKYRNGRWLQVLLQAPDEHGMIAGASVYHLGLALVSPRPGGIDLRVWSQRPHGPTLAQPSRLRALLLKEGLCDAADWERFATPDRSRRLQLAQQLPRLEVIEVPDAGGVI